MDFLKKNKGLAIAVGVLLVIILIFALRGGKKKTTKEEGKTASSRTSRRYRGRGRRGRSSLRRRSSSRKSSSRSRSRRGSRRGKKGKKEEGKTKKKERKIDYTLTIADIPSINNKELIEKRIKGELIRNYDYTYLYNPYEDWMERIYMQDTDGDGIPDDKDPDIDDDGFTNEEEKKAGTDPYDYRSHPKIVKKKKKKKEKENKKEKEKKEKKKLSPEEIRKRKLAEEEKKWNAVIKHYSYKGTFGLKYQRIAIFKDANSGEVILRRKGETIPGTRLVIDDVTDTSVVLRNMDTGSKKEIFAKTKENNSPSNSTSNSAQGQGVGNSMNNISQGNNVRKQPVSLPNEVSKKK